MPTHGLVDLFASGITVEAIASFHLQTCRGDDAAGNVLARMQEHQLDVMPVRDGGADYLYYVEAASLETVVEDGSGSGRPVRDAMRPLQVDHLVSAATPLLRTMELLSRRDWLMILRHDTVSGIVTRADLEKIPVRLYLFGLVSVMEMLLLDLIHEAYAADDWRAVLGDERLAKAQELYAERLRRNEALDLAACLQLADKRDLLLAHDRAWQHLGLPSKSRTRQLLNDVEKLRNRLAHGHDVRGNHAWPHIIHVARELRQALEAADASLTRREMRRTGEPT